MRWALDSPERLAALAGVELVPGVVDPLFDPYTRLVTRLLGVPVSLVSFVTTHQQIFAAASGLAQPWAARGATDLGLSFCQHVVTDDRPLRVDDAPNHARVRDNGAIEQLGVQAYLGVPLRAPAGEPLGSLCAIDTRPRVWTDEDLAALQEIGDAASAAIALRIGEHRQRAEAHDASHRLRTPLTALRLELEDLGSLHDLSTDAHQGLRAASARLGDLELVVDRFVDAARSAQHERDHDVDLVKVTASIAERRRLAALGDHVVHVAGPPVVVRTAPGAVRRIVELLVECVLAGDGSARLHARADGTTGRVAVLGAATAADGPATDAAVDDRLTLARDLAAGIGARITSSRAGAGYELSLPGAPTLRA